MNRTHMILLGALVAQVGIGAITWWPSSSEATPARKLVDLERDRITAITVQGKPPEGKDPTPVKLAKKDGHWVIASDQDYPAQADQVNDLLDKLTSIEVRLPEATRPEDANALKVGPDDYGRIVTLTAGSETKKLYIGAAGRNRVHVRLDGSNDIYEAKGMSEWSVKDTPRGYFDANYVNVNPGDVTSLTIRNGKGQFTLHKEDSGWTADDLPDGKSLDDAAVNRLVKRALHLRMTGPVGTTVKPEYQLEHGVRVEWTIAGSDGPSFGGYNIGATHDHHAYVKADGNDFVVDVTDGSIRELREASLEALLAKGS